MIYDKFYFLHIPKTGGRFFTKYIIGPIESQLKANGIDILEIPNGIQRHGGWHKDIDETTYIVSLFRDPAKQFVSSIAHMVAAKEGLIDEDNNFILKDKSEVLYIDKDFLFNMLEELKYLKNFQSQNFVLTTDKFPILTESRRAYQQNKKFDINLIHERVKRVNLMIRNEDLISLDYSVLINKLSKDLKVKIEIDLLNLDKEHFKNNSSENLFNKLNQKDIDTIYKNFMLDKEIYEDDSLFWNPN